MGKDTCRYITGEVRSMAWGVEALETLLPLVAEGKSSPLMCLIRPQKYSVLIGLYTDADLYVDLDYCRKNDIEVERGRFGFGALAWDSGTCEFTFLLPRKIFTSDEMVEVYKEILTKCAEIFSDIFHTEAYYRPLNDIEIRQRKVGGSYTKAGGDYRMTGSFFQVKEPDMEFASRALRTPPEKVADKVTATTAERISYLEEDYGKEVPWEEVIEKVRKYGEEYFNLNLIPGTFTDEEIATIDRAYETRLSDEVLLINSERRRLGPLPPGAERREKAMKLPHGPALRIVAYVNPEENRIINISITGSMHAAPIGIPYWLEGALKGVLIDEEHIRPRVEEIFNIGQIAMAAPDDYVKAIMAAVS